MTTTTFVNPDAESWTYEYPTDIRPAIRFHHNFPGYKATPLVPLPSLAQELGVKAVFAKDESSRMGLPAFKILGASWAVYRSIAAKTNLSLETSLDEMRLAACTAKLSLFAATSGNHGRAIAYLAKMFGIPATIFLGNNPDEHVLEIIASEGAKVVVVEGDYDDAVAEAARQTANTEGGLHIQDYAWEGYKNVFEWVVEGYSMMMHEIERQLAEQNLGVTHLVTPIGAGTLGLAVVAHAKSEGRCIAVIAVEPDVAACLNHNLRHDSFERILTSESIMTGMVCGNVGIISWPVLRRGVDMSVTINGLQCHDAIVCLSKNGVNAGPCGASTLAGLRKAVADDRTAARLDENSVVVLLITEGKRYYKIPALPTLPKIHK